MATDSNEADDAEFLAWVKAHANDCSHEAMERALDETEHLCRRPRLLQAEYLRVWIRAVVHSTKKRWDGIRTAREHLQVAERTVWREVAERVVWRARGPAPAAPELDRERTLRIFAANIRIAEDSGNRRAAKFLRRQLRKFETRDLG